MLRLRHNCTNIEEFQSQANMIGERFIQKGYEENFIKEKIEEVTQIPRSGLLVNKKSTSKQDLVPVVLEYNVHY